MEQQDRSSDERNGVDADCSERDYQPLHREREDQRDQSSKQGDRPESEDNVPLPRIDVCRPVRCVLAALVATEDPGHGDRKANDHRGDGVREAK